MFWSFSSHLWSWWERGVFSSLFGYDRQTTRFNLVSHVFSVELGIRFHWTVIPQNQRRKGAEVRVAAFPVACGYASCTWGYMCCVVTKVEWCGGASGTLCFFLLGWVNCNGSLQENATYICQQLNFAYLTGTLKVHCPHYLCTFMDTLPEVSFTTYTHTHRVRTLERIWLPSPRKR